MNTIDTGSFSSDGRRVVHLLSRVFQSVAKELGGPDLATKLVFSAGRGAVPKFPESEDIPAHVLSHRLIASWYTLLWFVVIPLYFRKSRPAHGKTSSELTLVITQHPNTPRPAWWLLAMQNAGNYLDAISLLSDETLEADLHTIVREMCTRPLEDKIPLDVISNLEMVLRLYGSRYWRRADQFRRKYATWMVCDLDGQVPKNVSPQQIVRGARILREYAINLYLSELRSLAERISRCLPTNSAHRELEQRINLINNSLVASIRGLGMPNAFRTESDFCDVLDRLRYEVNKAKISDSRIDEDIKVLRDKAEVFGFAFFGMFPRLNALALRTLGELFGSKPSEFNEGQLSEENRWLLNCARAFLEVRNVNGRALTFIISNYEGERDDLNLRSLLNFVGFKGGDYNIVHLHEGDEPVRNAPKLSKEALKLRPDEQKNQPYIVMFGGSDMQRECGCAGQWELARSIQRTGIELRSEGIRPIFFYGRADTFFRWGGSLDEFRAAQPDTEAECLVLVQGDDVIRRRLTYQQADIHRGHSWAIAETPDPIFQGDVARDFDELFRTAIDRYKALTTSGAFEKYFNEVTPAAVISAINRSVRPKSRSQGIGEATERSPKWSEWRAIVTIQAGAICGYIPQQFGAGIALSDNSKVELFREMWRNSRWFRYWLRGVMYEAARVNFETIEFRAAGKHRAIIEELREDFALAQDAFFHITGEQLRTHHWLTTNAIRLNVAKLEAKYGRELSSAAGQALKAGYMAILASLGENG